MQLIGGISLGGFFLNQGGESLFHATGHQHDADGDEPQHERGSSNVVRRDCGIDPDELHGSADDHRDRRDRAQEASHTPLPVPCCN